MRFRRHRSSATDSAPAVLAPAVLAPAVSAADVSAATPAATVSATAPAAPAVPAVSVPAATGLAALGGAVGSTARHLLALAWPATSGTWPWATLVTNVSGAFLLGCLLTAVSAPRTAPPWVRPLVGTGVLGGFTTFSLHSLDCARLVAAGETTLAALYVAVTLVGAVTATALGVWATGRLVPSGAGRGGR